MNNVLRRIGVDPGFGGFKMCEVIGEEIKTFLMPSSVGLGASTDEISMAGILRNRSARKPYRVKFEGIEYLVGHNVAAYTRPIDQMDYNRFTDSPELRASFYAGLAQMTGGGQHTVGLVIGLPVEVVKDTAEANKVQRQIRGWLVGEHSFMVDGIEFEVEVARVRAKTPQPVGSWQDWGLDYAGQWIKGAAALKAPTLIIDPGYNSLDVVLTYKGKIQSRETDGDKLGMRRAAERLQSLLKQKYNVEPDLRVCDEEIQAVSMNRKAETYVKGELVNVSRLAKQALNTTEADAIDFVSRALDQRNAREYRVFLTGGGAISLINKLLRQYEHANAMPGPVLANARGLGKMAARAGFLD